MMPEKGRLVQVGVVLFLLGLFFFILGNGRHSLWDRDETRNAEAARFMVESGDYIVPYLNGEIRNDKPILAYWAMSASIRLFGANAFAVRLHSALGGAITVLLLYIFALRMGASFAGAILTALGAIYSVLFFIIFKASTHDALLVMSLVAAMLFYWENRSRPFSWGKHIGFWMALGLVGLAKGPVGLAVAAMAIWTEQIWTHFAERRLRLLKDRPEFPPQQAGKSQLALRWAVGLVVFLAVAMPWTWMVWQRTDGAFIMDSINEHVIQRAQTGLEGHGSDKKDPLIIVILYFFYYIPVLPMMLMPMTAFLLVAARWACTLHTRPKIRFLISWIVPGFIMFSLVQTKLPHYMATLLPPFFLILGLWWTDEEIRASRSAPELIGGPSTVWWRVGAVFMAVVGAAALLAIPVAFIFERVYLADENIPGGILWSLSCVLLAMGGGFLAGAHFWWRLRPLPAVKWTLAGMTIACLVLASWSLPALEPLRPGKSTGEWLRLAAPPETRQMGLIYKEPSLIFYSRKGLEEMPREGWNIGLERLSNKNEPWALIAIEENWKDWKKGYGEERIPDYITVRYRQRFYDFQKGGWKDLVVVGNWEERP
ncbi:MAG: ArnT family glycosyltransferase [bacterium]